MNELIKIESKDGELLVSARDLHKGLILDEGKSERFSQWFNRYLKYGFEENIDYVVCKKIYAANQYGGEKELEDYALKIDMAKEICMLQRSEKGRQCRKYFIECERKLKENKLQLTRKEELQLKLFSNDSMEVVNAHKELVQIEVEEATKPLLTKIKEDEPLVTFADRILKEGDNILVRDLAKIASDEGYKIGERRLYNKLREWKYICNGSTMPTQYAMEREYFIVETGTIHTPYGHKQIFTTKVTPKGQIHIVERLIKLQKKEESQGLITQGEE